MSKDFKGMLKIYTELDHTILHSTTLHYTTPHLTTPHHTTLCSTTRHQPNKNSRGSVTNHETSPTHM